MARVLTYLCYLPVAVKGLKHFFHPPTLATPRITVQGIGVGEAMRPLIVDRPAGTADHLFMLFYESVELLVDGKTRRARRERSCCGARGSVTITVTGSACGAILGSIATDRR